MVWSLGGQIAGRLLLGLGGVESLRLGGSVAQARFLALSISDVCVCD